MTKMPRAERYAQVKAMRDNGLLLREIAVEVGLSISTVHDVLVDPTGEKARARKARLYTTSCIDCGKSRTTNGLDTGGGRCRRCHGARVRADSRRWIIDSMQEWADTFGAPPSSADWNPAMARNSRYCAWKADRYTATGRPWPSTHLVQSNFGSWNEGLVAAGFEPLDPSETWMGHSGVALRDLDEELAA